MVWIDIIIRVELKIAAKGGIACSDFKVVTLDYEANLDTREKY